MAGWRQQLRYHGRSLVGNWRESDAAFAEKAARAVRNRAKSLGNKGCCGNYGEPGC